MDTAKYGVFFFKKRQTKVAGGEYPGSTWRFFCFSGSISSAARCLERNNVECLTEELHIFRYSPSSRVAMQNGSEWWKKRLDDPRPIADDLNAACQNAVGQRASLPFRAAWLLAALRDRDDFFRDILREQGATGLTFLGAGGDAIVFDMGNGRVIKILPQETGRQARTNRPQVVVPLMGAEVLTTEPAQEQQRRMGGGEAGAPVIEIHIEPRLSISSGTGRGEEDTAQAAAQVAAAGLTFTDAKSENVGRDSIGRLFIVDSGAVSRSDLGTRSPQGVSFVLPVRNRAEAQYEEKELAFEATPFGGMSELAAREHRQRIEQQITERRNRRDAVYEQAYGREQSIQITEDSGETDRGVIVKEDERQTSQIITKTTSKTMTERNPSPALIALLTEMQKSLQHITSRCESASQDFSRLAHRALEARPRISPSAENVFAQIQAALSSSRHTASSVAGMIENPARMAQVGTNEPDQLSGRMLRLASANDEMYRTLLKASRLCGEIPRQGIDPGVRGALSRVEEESGALCKQSAALGQQIESVNSEVRRSESLEDRQEASRNPSRVETPPSRVSAPAALRH